MFSHVHLYSHSSSQLSVVNAMFLAHANTLLLAQRCCHFNVVKRDALTTRWTTPETFSLCCLPGKKTCDVTLGVLLYVKLNLCVYCLSKKSLFNTWGITLAPLPYLLTGALVSVAQSGVGGGEDIDHGVLSEEGRRRVGRQREIVRDKWIR